MKRLLAAASAVVIAAAAVGWAGPPSAAGATVIDSTKATFTIWHGVLAAGGSEDAAFNTVLASMRPRFPNVTFRVVRQPWVGEIYTKSEANPAQACSTMNATNGT
jgi:ABC-type glycerol-3-phosphate transport system substrate-binding protein